MNPISSDVLAQQAWANFYRAVAASGVWLLLLLACLSFCFAVGQWIYWPWGLLLGAFALPWVLAMTRLLWRLARSELAAARNVSRAEADHAGVHRL